jgi:polyhydroxybutyrate depolymerase
MKKGIILLFFAFAACVTSRAQQRTEHIMVDGISRQFESYIPATANAAAKLPVVISLHGRLGNGKGMMSFADFRPIADREKFIVVCPDGIDRSWNAGRATPANKKGINDVKFIDQLITYIVNTYNGDAKRVYVTGMSNGGFMSSRLACELNNRIAAIAVVGASMISEMNYHPGKPIPVMYIQGTEDTFVPFIGGKTKGVSGNVYSHAEVLKLWVGVDKCDETPVITNLPDKAGDGTSIIKEEYVNKTTGIKVIGYTVTNGGHTWPGGTQYLPKFMVGKVSHNMNACEAIWDFFKGVRGG